MSINVVKPGLLTTIQDLGRKGYLHQGVLESGAMDKNSLRTANILVRNKAEEAVLELTMVGPVLQFSEPSLIAVTGGGMLPVINGVEYPLGCPIFVPAQANVSFKPTKSGARAYLAVAGGFDVPIIMGSKSTYLRAKIGGLNGRAVEKGDQLTIGAIEEDWLKKRINQATENGEVAYERWNANGCLLRDTAKQNVIRAVKGAHFHLFTEESQKHILQSLLEMTNQSDRMGYRLKIAEKIELSESFSLLSEAVAFGTVQAPPDGQPIILMADRQTTGGYPRILQIASIDLARLSQMRPGTTFRFQEITMTEAEALYMKQEAAFEVKKAAIQLKWDELKKKA